MQALELQIHPPHAAFAMAALLMSCLPTQLDSLSKANIASFVDSCDTPLIQLIFMRECRDDPVFLKDELERALIERYVDRAELSEYSNLALRAAENTTSSTP